LIFSFHTLLDTADDWLGSHCWMMSGVHAQDATRGMSFTFISTRFS